eukprot:CAMPEP_0201284346 /NCGR_PEP_ID=MMETSP1317-20130820/70904_1 /ASSEMBLY_ACC=CAM_ASM_000770 /TAXON_ID=187299 /ORGANISM="Undescribed Undescribed, Strain Undescribed" /LENGTH=127 /DNA_ID=CAMNT_0047604127 /DNA_START=248 /DNA_END=627 /DNA_ORIENTATION=+
MKNELQLPSNSLKAGKVYVFTATVVETDQEGQRTGGSEVAVTTLYSDLVCVVNANATSIWSWDALYLDTQGSEDPNEEEWSWVWTCVQEGGNGTGDQCINHATQEEIAPDTYHEQYLLVPYKAMTDS